MNAQATETGKGRRTKVAILVNQLTPYRLPIYGALGADNEVLIMHGGREKNRTWKLDVPPTVRTSRVWGVQIPGKRATGVAGVLDRTYIHLNIGLLWQIPIYRPNTIITVEMGLRTVIALIYGKLARVPVWVWSGVTLHSERNVSKGRIRLRRILVGQVKRWISYGAEATKYLESLGVARKNILQIQNCVPQETFLKIPNPSKKWFEDLPRPVILTVGQLIARKGLDKLIEACGRLANQGTKFTLVIVGQGPEQERLEELARASNIDNFLILPNQSQPMLNEIYRAVDVFVFPTLEDIWGLVVNEAMWAGLPVLCSKYAGCAVELLPESNIFDPLSPESFDTALTMAVDGTAAVPDQSRLRTWQEVSAMIGQSIATGTPVT